MKAVCGLLVNDEELLALSVIAVGNIVGKMVLR